MPAAPSQGRVYPGCFGYARPLIFNRVSRQSESSTDDTPLLGAGDPFRQCNTHIERDVHFDIDKVQRVQPAATEKSMGSTMHNRRLITTLLATVFSVALVGFTTTSANAKSLESAPQPTVTPILVAGPTSVAVTPDPNPLCGEQPVSETISTVLAPEAAGIAASISGGVRGEVNKYTFADGSVINKKIPPSTWTPKISTASEAVYFGIDPAPAARDSEAYASWKYEWIDHYTKTDTSTPCLFDNALVPSNNASSANWGGDIGMAGSYTKVSGNSTFTTGAACVDTPSGYSSWVGLGGWGIGTGLIQAGVESWNYGLGAGLQHATFGEILGHGEDHHVDLSGYMGQAVDGHQFTYAAQYVNSSDAHLGVHDLTTGVNYPADPAGFGSHNMSYYYDSATAEAIDERPTAGTGAGSSAGLYMYLRGYGSNSWGSVYTTQSGGSAVGIRSVTNQLTDMIDGFGSTLSTAAAGSTATSFTDSSHGCGHLQVPPTS